MNFALLRMPVLAVEEAARMVADGDVTDPVAALAIDLATGSDLRAETGGRSRAALLRYVARMGGRATPYGLFAGTAPAVVGGHRSLGLASRSRHRVRVRVDIAVLERVVAEAMEEADPEDVPLRLNPWARDDGTTVRFATPGDATAPVVRLRSTPAIAEALDALGDAEVDTRELVRVLSGRIPGAEEERLTEFVTGLRSRGLLQVSDGLLAPGVEPLRRARELVERVGDRRRAAALRALEPITARTHRLDQGLRDRLDRSWAEAARLHPGLAHTPRQERFDLHPEQGTDAAVLDRRTIADLRAAARRVAALAGPEIPVGLDMAAFRTAFARRYEDAEVPLLEAVDLESGVLPVPGRATSALATEAGLGFDHSKEAPRFHPELLDLLGSWHRDGGSVDISHLPEADDTGSRALLATLVGAADPTEHGGPHSVLVGGVGRAPHALTARFGLGRPQVADAIASEVTAEAGPPGLAEAETGGPLYAELVHHAGGRIGNVLIRPRVLPETIALHGAHGGTLHPGRLLLRLRPDGFHLRDATTGRPVVVELDTAHNVDLHGVDPLYSLLGHLAATTGAGWSWGPLARLAHLPRVTCGRVIVSPERWTLAVAEVAEILAAPNPAAALRSRIPGIGDRRWVGAGEYDHVLPIDLTSDPSVRAALDRTGGRAITLVELPHVESPAVRGPKGGHVAEVVVPLGPSLRTPPPPHPGTIRHEAEHGDAWVYARLHCGPAGADRIIVQARRLADELRAEGLADLWFFLRYQDGDGHHVRLRLRSGDLGHRARLLAATAEFGERAVSEGTAVRFSTDRYVPEIARYGGAEGIRAAEALFSASSDRVSAVLQDLPDEEDRLRLAIADTVHWCRELFDDHGKRLDFLRVCRDGLGVSVRKRGNPIGAFARSRGGPLRAGLDRIRPDESVTKALRALIAAQASDSEEVDLRSVFGSALHLHLNRLFAFDAVRMEYLSHEFARRHLLRLRALEGKG